MTSYPKPPLGFEDKLIYLAGPMTGLPDFGFREATRKLRLLGFRIYSPHQRWNHEDEETRAARDPACYILHGFELLLKCNSIALMPGWRKSGGSQKELILALHAGYSIYYYQPEEDFPLLELK
jgi:hypothetical protein